MTAKAILTQTFQCSPPVDVLRQWTESVTNLSVSDKYVDTRRVLKIAIRWDEERKAWEVWRAFFQAECEVPLSAVGHVWSVGTSLMPAWLWVALGHFCLLLSFPEMRNLTKPIGIGQMSFKMSDSFIFIVKNKQNKQRCLVDTHRSEGQDTSGGQVWTAGSQFLCLWTALQITPFPWELGRPWENNST